MQILADVDGNARLVAVTVRGDDVERDEIVGRQGRGAGAGLDRIGRVVVGDRPVLDQSDGARVGIEVERERDQV